MSNEMLKNVQGTLLYACIQKPVSNYDKDGEEWKISVVVDEETAEIWDSLFKKQKAKAIKRKNFEATYKIAPPDNGEDILYVVTLKKPTTDSKGNDLDPKFAPKAFQKLPNGKRKDITQEALIGNGSVGLVSIFPVDNDKFGLSARLNNVLVTELVEYHGGEAGSEFDDFTDGEEDEFEDDTPAPKTAARKTAKPPAEEVEDEPAPKAAKRRTAAPPPADKAAEEDDATPPWEDVE